jgi:hypothetical protein
MNRGIENNKSEYRSGIIKKTMNDNMTRQQYKQRKYRKITASSGASENQRKYRGHKIDILYTV